MTGICQLEGGVGSLSAAALEICFDSASACGALQFLARLYGTFADAAVRCYPQLQIVGQTGHVEIRASGRQSIADPAVDRQQFRFGSQESVVGLPHRHRRVADSTQGTNRAFLGLNHPIEPLSGVASL